MRILIAEDDPVSLKTLHSIVDELGQVELARDGAEAFDKYCEAFDAGASFDVILLDVMMPEYNGQEVLAAIREREAESGIGVDEGVPVIMTTAMDDSQNLYQAHANGCVNYLVKPVSREKVLSAIRRLGLS